MAAYDPATAHRNEWRWMSFVEDAVYEPPPGDDLGADVIRLKFKRDDINHKDYAGLASRLATLDKFSGAAIWNHTQHDFEPGVNGLLRTDDGKGWVIRGVQESRFGHWVAAVEPEVVDG